MRFFKKLFGSASNTGGKNNYALATVKYATSPEINETNAIVYSNRVLTFRDKGQYVRPVSDYTRAPQANTNNTINIMNLISAGLKWKRITVISYRYFSSKTDLFIHRS
jgi:hypothetical protein